VLRVRVESASKIWLVGTDSGCRVRLFRSADGGATWQQQPTTDGAWHRMLDPDSRQVHAPKGPIPAPCAGGQQVSDVVGLNPLTAAVLCSGGAVHQTGDGGKTWRQARAAGVLGDALAAPATLYVVEAAEDCAGVRLSRTSAGGWERLGCVQGASADTPLALSFADASNGLLASGNATYLTYDAGRTWRRLGLNAGTSGVARAG
jgi:photosystem II stability/assembly factor-like uncharacterized protein